MQNQKEDYDLVKKQWLDFLFYTIGKQQYDFRLSSLKKTDNGMISTKWRKFSDVVFPVDYDEGWKLREINNREILPNEVVIDLEEKERLTDVLEKLLKLGVNFYVFDTHSRGYHIHIFYKKELTTEEKLKFIGLFKGDMQKAFPKTAIALEFATHYKSGEIKSLMYTSDEVNVTGKGKWKKIQT